MVTYSGGKLVEALRERRGELQTELAKRAEISQGYLSGIETGAKTNPNMKIISRLGALLGFTMEEFMEGREFQ